ncbi:hypothetical protein ElyMa_005810500 [Elysia marginata]|uniref:Reverse transcriptase domain-containing protein n=1 Tax=Elysia marginata TaxID=1093978 RepID=A0AAV4FVE6_9GAST|nr:hypothetical protein ElyMa_005810500 [Elysia marginata]
MKINTKSNRDILIDGKGVENVTDFKYLGSYLTADGETLQNLRARLCQRENIASHGRSQGTQRSPYGGAPIRSRPAENTERLVTSPPCPPADNLERSTGPRASTPTGAPDSRFAGPVDTPIQSRMQEMALTLTEDDQVSAHKGQDKTPSAVKGPLDRWINPEV